jgi:polyisoprenoid-binding protein YceI
MKTTLLKFTFLPFLALSALASPAGYKIDPSHSSVGFSIRHLVSQVEGRFGKFEGQIEMDRQDLKNSQVSFSVDAASINTDNEKRDSHLRGKDFFEVDKFPTLQFKSKRVQPRGADKVEVFGTMTIHGVSKDMSIPVTILGVGPGFQGEVAGFSSDFTINRKDFGIVWNSNLDKGGSVLGDDVQVRLRVEAARQ